MPPRSSVGTAVYAVEALLVTQGPVDSFFDNRVYYALLVAASLTCLGRGVLVRAERLPWLLLGTALSLWTAGDLYYYFVLSERAEVPIPSIADAFYLAFYPSATSPWRSCCASGYAAFAGPLARRGDRAARRRGPRRCARASTRC